MEKKSADSAERYIAQVGERLSQSPQSRATVELGVSASEDPFKPFEDEMASEATTIDHDDVLAEESTSLLQEAAEPPYLEVFAGKESGKQFVLGVGETTIGRGIENDIILTDVSVSRRHAIIRRDGKTLRFFDVGSGNGTRVNGKRGHDTSLQDGDRLELGQTIMVLRVPAGKHAAPAQQPERAQNNAILTFSPKQHPSSPAASLLTPATPVSNTAAGSYPAQPHTTTGTMGVTQWVTRPETTSAIVLPRLLVIVFSVASLLLAILLGVAVTMLWMKREERKVSAGGGGRVYLNESEFVAGLEAFKTRRWDAAEKAFGRVLKGKPDDARAMQYLKQIRDAKEHELLLASAKEALLKNDFNRALNQAAAIPDSSPFALDARDIRNKAEQQRLQGYLQLARVAIKNGNFEEARKQWEQAYTLAPLDERVLALARELGVRPDKRNAQTKTPQSADNESKPTPEPPRVAQPQVQKSKESSSPAKAHETASKPHDTQKTSGARSASSQKNAMQAIENRMLSLYQNGDFMGASSYLRGEGEKVQEQDKKRLMQLANSIDQFSSLYGRVKSAGTNIESVMRQTQFAMSIDQSISSGHYAKQLRPLLVDAYLRQGKRLWDQHQAVTACQSFRQVLSLDPTQAIAQQYTSRCDAQAKEMFAKAQSVEEKDVASARSLYREVLAIVGPTSPLYTQAYQKLQAISPRPGSR